jgi:two-component system, chemotaxis family, sensor kinase Cph1
LRRIVSAQEIERQRISRDLHDHLGQQLTALRLTIASLKDQAQPHAELDAPIEQIQSLTKQIDGDVDFLAWELRPAALDELGMSAMLENFVQEWTKHFNTETEYHCRGLNSIQLQPETEINLYRIAQEALNNIAKHAEASHVDVLLERRGTDAVLVVEDNGKGFNPNEKNNLKDGLGLISMRERASLVGGTLEIESAPGQGTTIFVRVPIRGVASQE